MYANRQKCKPEGVTLNFQDFVEPQALLIPSLVFRFAFIRVNPRLNMRLRSQTGGL